MVVEHLDTFSPSAGKPAAFMEAVKYQPWFENHHSVASFEPVSIDYLKLVHDPRYVDGVFNRSVNNGFENNDPRVPEACRYTVGSLVAAVKCAGERPNAPACSPTSGFHHAGYGWGGGFCTFNGLMVAAALFLRDNPGERIGIIDCDFHYGDGTEDILKRKPELARHVVHHTSGKFFKGDDKQGERMEFFEWLKDAITSVNDRGCKVAIYQAGADMHIDDPLGGLLDDADLRRRDAMVFQHLHCGVAWNLAGGYRTDGKGCGPVIKTHLATCQEANISIGRRMDYFAKRQGAAA